MEIGAVITILSGIAGILGFLYILLIGDKTLKEWWTERKLSSGSKIKKIIKEYAPPKRITAKTDLLEAHRLLGVYTKRADDGDDLAIPWLIEFSKHPNPEVRLISCTKGFWTLQRYNSEVMDRLKEMEENDPVLQVRQAARKARSHIALTFSIPKPES